MRNLIYPLIVIFILAVLVFQGVSSILPTYSMLEGPHVVIDNKPIRVIVADDLEVQLQGLSDRIGLCQDCGMLFVFPQPQVRGFWMKNMHFPLDIVWINGDTIVKIDKRLAPEGEVPERTYTSETPVNYVLEVNGGYSDAFKIKAGDRVEIDI